MARHRVQSHLPPTNPRPRVVPTYASKAFCSLFSPTMTLSGKSPADRAHSIRGTTAHGRDRKRSTCADATSEIATPDTLWNTRYIDAIVAMLRESGEEVNDEDVARLSPLKSRHINFLGRYAFEATQPAQGLRPLRNPDEPDDIDEELA